MKQTVSVSVAGFGYFGTKRLNSGYKNMLVLPVHTAEVERGFSQMNLVKTKLRSSLQPESLASFLTDKPSKQDFDNPSIML